MNEVWTNVVDSGARARAAGLDSALALTRLATRTQGLLARQQMLALERCLEAGTRQWALAGAFDKPQELLGAQTDLMRDLGEGLADVARRSYEIGVQARDEFAHLAQSGVEAAGASAVPAAATPAVKASAKPAAKAATRRVARPAAKATTKPAAKPAAKSPARRAAARKAN